MKLHAILHEAVSHEKIKAFVDEIKASGDESKIRQVTLILAKEANRRGMKVRK